MYIVAIGWMFVVVCMTVVEAVTTSVIGGLVTLLLYGVLPLALFLWLFGTPQRRRNRVRGQAPMSGASFTRGRPATPTDDDQ
jgi:hypothetical protein